MTYNLQKELKQTADSLANGLSFILITSVTLSFLARLHWLADFFSHFLIQYLIGAVILGLYYTITRNSRMIIPMCVILALGAIEINLMQTDNHKTKSDWSVSVMQYNRLIYQTEHDDLSQFLRDYKPDIVVLQEAGFGYDKLGSDVKDIYPYQVSHTRTHAFGMMILSHYPIQKQNITPLEGEIVNNFVIRLEIKTEILDQPLVLYALHALPPVGNATWNNRNAELQKTAQLIKNDTYDYVVMMGDWNITPYSPFFKDLLKTSGLQYQNASLYPPMTWPSTFRLPIFQVPIDHVLTTPALATSYKKPGPPMGSDHYPLLATLKLAK